MKIKSLREIFSKKCVNVNMLIITALQKLNKNIVNIIVDII